MGKKGLTAVEWSISAAIFILFIAWFMIITRTSLFPEREQSSLLNIQERLNERMTSYYSTPVIISANNSKHLEPVILKKKEIFNFTSTINGKKTGRYKDYIFFLYPEPKGTDIFFYLDLDNNTKNISNASAYNVTLDYDLGYSQTKDFRVNFFECLPVSFMNPNNIINGYEVRINGVSIRDLPALKEFNGSDFFSRHTYITGDFNHTTIVFGNNTKAIMILESQPEKNINIKYSFSDMAFFYSDNLNYHELPVKDCLSYESDFIWLNTTQNTIAYYFPNKGEIRICSNSTEKSISYNTMADSSMLLRMEFNISLNDALKRKTPYYYAFGLKENVKGFTSDDIKFFSNKSIDDIYNIFNEKNFKMVIDAGKMHIEKGALPGNTNVHSKVYYYSMIDDPANITSVKFTFLVW